MVQFREIVELKPEREVAGVREHVKVILGAEGGRYGGFHVVGG